MQINSDRKNRYALFASGYLQRYPTTHKPMNSGKIKFWNDEKGYGFITPDNGGNDVFLHIKSFKRSSQRPEIGHLVSYDTTQGNKGRLQAVNVHYMDEKHSHSFVFTMATFSVLAAILFSIGISVSAYLGKIPEFILAVYVGASIITFITYALDKSAAKRGRWRTKERTLHLLALVGGWPGALIAQQTFRHKTRKESFRAVFWVTVLLNCGGLLWFSQPGSVQKTIDFIDTFIQG